MNETEEVQSASEPAAAEPDVPVEAVVASDTEAAVDQLRALLCGMVLGLLLTSAAFTLFVFKQTRTMKNQIQARMSQLQQGRDYEKAALPAVQELARYSVGKPELQAIFTRHGMQIGQSVGPAGAPSAPSGK